MTKNSNRRDGQLKEMAQWQCKEDWRFGVLNLPEGWASEEVLFKLSFCHENCHERQDRR